MPFLFLTAVMMVPSAITQNTITIGRPVKPDMSKLVDHAVSDKIRVRVKTERKAVVDWPDRDLTLATPPLWSNPSRGIALNYPASALAVERVRGGSPSACETFFDRIDLSAVRKRGFTLVGYSAEPLSPRHGYSRETPLEAIAVNTRLGDVYTAFMDQADQIRIRPPLFQKREGATNVCWSGYRLTVTLEGPVGARPFGFTRPGRPRRR